MGMAKVRVVCITDGCAEEAQVSCATFALCANCCGKWWSRASMEAAILRLERDELRVKLERGVEVLQRASDAITVLRFGVPDENAVASLLGEIASTLAAVRQSPPTASKEEA